MGTLSDLPADFNQVLCDRSKVALEHFLETAYARDTDRKVVHVQHIIDRFKDGSIHAELNCMENLVAATLVLTELSIGKET